LNNPCSPHDPNATTAAVPRRLGDELTRLLLTAVPGSTAVLRGRVEIGTPRRHENAIDRTGTPAAWRGGRQGILSSFAEDFTIFGSEPVAEGGRSSPQHGYRT